MFTNNKSTYALLYAFIIEIFKCMILFRNIELHSLAQSVERWIRCLTLFEIDHLLHMVLNYNFIKTIDLFNNS